MSTGVWGRAPGSVTTGFRHVLCGDTLAPWLTLPSATPSAAHPRGEAHRQQSSCSRLSLVLSVYPGRATGPPRPQGSALHTRRRTTCHEHKGLSPLPSPPEMMPTSPQSPRDAELIAEAKLLRQHKGRLEARMQILEDHNKQLESQLHRLRQLLEQVRYPSL